MTATGKPIIDEVILKDIGSEISTQFLRCLTVTKMLGMISEGVNAWLKLCTNDRYIITVALQLIHLDARTEIPNLKQARVIPGLESFLLHLLGSCMVGADLSGIELRMLAHYLARYDGGRYAKILLEDDIHQVNADRIGISRRRAVKTVTYAFLYGAGDQKIGLSYDPQLSASAAKRKGKEIKEAFVVRLMDSLNFGGY